MNRGKYIVIEGPEGVGKTTQLQELARRLQAAGLPVRQLREPDSQSDLTARAIRQLTQDPRYPMNTRTEVLLYNAARSQSLSVIKQSVDHGVICLVDRNYLTTLAIQYYGRGDVPDYQTINSIISFAVGGVEPDLCVVLDAPVNILTERLKDRYNGERFDNLDDAFLERVRAGYLWEAKQRNLPVVFATEEQSDVANNIWKLVSDTLAIREVSKATAMAPPASLKQIIEQKQLPDNPPASEPPINLIDEGLPLSSTAAKPDTQSVSFLLAPLIGTTKLSPEEKPQFYTPTVFKPAVKKQYTETLNTIFENYTTMLNRLTTHIQGNRIVTDKKRNEALRIAAREEAADYLRVVLPIATLASVSLDVPQQDINSLTTDLLSSNLPEAEHFGQFLQKNEPETVPIMLANGSLQDSNEAVSNYLRETSTNLQLLTSEHLPDSYATPADPISLVDFWPKNELSLLPGMLYDHSNLSLDKLQTEINTWPYDLKSDTFNAYIGKRLSARQRPGPALERAHYSWDLLTDYASFVDMQQNLKPNDLGRQLLTPRYGYDVPDLIEAAGLTEQFEACFDTSLKLYSVLQQAGHPLEAQYVTLMGHKMRWKVTYNAREAFKVLEASYDDNPSAEALTAKMYEKLAEVHPLLSDAITFANTD